MKKRDNKGRFLPGQGGRPKGSKNVVTKLTGQFIVEFLEDDQGAAVQDWLKLTPSERWNIRTRLLEFATPKLSRSDLSVDVSALSEEEVDRLLSKALEKLQSNEE